MKNWQTLRYNPDDLMLVKVVDSVIDLRFKSHLRQSRKKYKEWLCYCCSSDNWKLRESSWYNSFLWETSIEQRCEPEKNPLGHSGRFSLIYPTSTLLIVASISVPGPMGWQIAGADKPTVVTKVSLENNKKDRSVPMNPQWAAETSSNMLQKSIIIHFQTEGRVFQTLRVNGE